MTLFDASLMTTIWLSLKVSLVVVALIIPPAIFVGLRLARGKHTGFRVLIESLISLPLAMPPVALGYLLLLFFGRTGALGRVLYEKFGLQISFSTIGVILAAAVVAFPLAVRSVRVSIEGIDPHFEEAALTLGASKWQTFWKITLPLSWPGILGGATLAYIRSLGEFGATMILAGNIEGETRTISVALWTYLQQPNGEQAALRLLVFSIAFGFLCLLFSELCVRKLRHYRID